MRKHKNRRKDSWKTAGLIVVAGLVLHLVALIVFHAEPIGGWEGEVDVTGVSLLPMDRGEGESRALREQAALLDSTPLFLPTQWNAGSDPQVHGAARRPGDVFSPFPPELSLENVQIGETRVDGSPPDLLEGLGRIEAAPFHAFRGGPSETPELEKRTAQLQVLAVDNGEEVLSATFDEPLPGQDQFWAPMVFGVHVTRLGLAGSPVLLEGSGVDEIDAFFNRHLRERVFTERLPPPGYYRVLIGP